MKHGPQLLAAAGAISAFVKQNPSLPAWAKERLSGVASQLDRVNKRRGDAEQIRGKLEIVRKEAEDVQSEAAGPSPDGSATWLQRANDIERALRLAEQQEKTAQKRTLTRLKADADALLAEVIDTIAGGRPDAQSA